MLPRLKGCRFRGASDLVLDLQSVNIDGKQYRMDAVDISRRGKSRVGANKRTSEYTGGGAAFSAIKVPAESVLTFRLDKPPKVTAAQ